MRKEMGGGAHLLGAYPVGPIFGICDSDETSLRRARPAARQHRSRGRGALVTALTQPEEQVDIVACP